MKHGFAQSVRLRNSDVGPETCYASFFVGPPPRIAQPKQQLLHNCDCHGLVLIYGSKCKISDFPYSRFFRAKLTIQSTLFQSALYGQFCAEKPAARILCINTEVYSICFRMVTDLRLRSPRAGSLTSFAARGSPLSQFTARCSGARKLGVDLRLQSGLELAERRANSG